MGAGARRDAVRVHLSDDSSSVSITQGTVHEEVDVTQTEMALTVLLFVVIPGLVLVGVPWYVDF